MIGEKTVKVELAESQPRGEIHHFEVILPLFLTTNLTVKNSTRREKCDSRVS